MANLSNIFKFVVVFLSIKLYTLGMLLLDVNNLSKNFGHADLFKDLSFSLSDGESISIVGPNGTGKSTLLKIIAGIEKADKGSVNIRKGAKVAYLDQVGSSINDDRAVAEFLKDAFSSLNEMEERLNRLQEKMNNAQNEADFNKNMEKYCALVEEFSLAGGYNTDTEINTVIEGLKIDRAILSQSYNKLSGGEKTLVQLAKGLLIKPDLFLLDEPTNHLDIERIEWLENYIKSFKGATIIVSHDRYFLDKMSNKILSLDGDYTKVYACNYSNYLIERERDFERQMSDYKNQQLLIERLEKQIKYFSEQGMAKNSSTLCDRAHALQTQLERIKNNAVKRPKVRKKLNVEFDEVKKTSTRVIVAKNLSVSLPNGRKILDDISLEICAKERVALIGSNGSGKSTFLKTILGIQDLKTEGEVFIGPSVKIGYLPQIIAFEDENAQLLEYFKNQIGVDEERARKILYKFQFYKQDFNKRVKNLSGGEKVRIKLAELLMQKINTLIFDEPTNHIDIPTKEVLEDAIEEFDGTLIFVSHDRYFINKFADKTIEFKDGKINVYLGGYDYYKQEKMKLNK